MTTPTRRYSTKEAAERIGVHKDTLLDWLARGLVREPMRDRRNWRIWTDEEIQQVIVWNNQVKPGPDRPAPAPRSRVREVAHS